MPVERDAAVVFLDLSGFTGLSEQLGATGTRALLKDFHSIVEDETTRHGGLVGTFMGDGAMLLFGLPKSGEDDPQHALAATFALWDALQPWIGTVNKTQEAGIGLRIGLHCGPVMLSRLGPDTHQHITVSGDTVNVASRLLEIASDHGVGIVLSDDALTAAGPFAAGGAEPLSGPHKLTIRGRARTLAVWFAKENRPSVTPGRNGAPPR